MDEAARCVLQNRTGLELPFLEQFYTFGSLDRRNQSDKKSTLKVFRKISAEFEKWVDQRFIGTAYFSLVDIRECEIFQDEISDSCEWVSVVKLPELLYDHGEMVEKALDRIRMQINYLPIGITLLPEKLEADSPSISLPI